MEENGTGSISLSKGAKKMQKDAGVKLVELHGCVGYLCEHIYVPQDKRVTCPNCGHARYKPGDNKTPNELVYYFPLRERLTALLKLSSYLHFLQVCLYLFVPLPPHSHYLFVTVAVRTFPKKNTGSNIRRV